MPRSDDRPALQNIPVRTEEGRHLRDLFLRPLPLIDYSEIERCMAENLSEGDAIWSTPWAK
jgi:DNA polymerase I-like protein with 3'-5' exonuclease and polymerase domains